MDVPFNQALKDRYNTMYCKCGNYITTWKTNPDYCRDCLRASDWSYYSVVDDDIESFDEIFFEIVNTDEEF